MYNGDACIRKELQITIYFSGMQMLVFIFCLYYDTGDTGCTNFIYLLGCGLGDDSSILDDVWSGIFVTGFVMKVEMGHKNTG